MRSFSIVKYHTKIHMTVYKMAKRQGPNNLSNSRQNGMDPDLKALNPIFFFSLILFYHPALFSDIKCASLFKAERAPFYFLYSMGPAAWSPTHLCSLGTPSKNDFDHYIASLSITLLTSSIPSFPLLNTNIGLTYIVTESSISLGINCSSSLPFQ